MRLDASLKEAEHVEVLKFMEIDNLEEHNQYSFRQPILVSWFQGVLMRFVAKRITSSVRKTS